MDPKDSVGNDVRTREVPTDDEIISNAVREVVAALGLDPSLPNAEPVELIRLYDNLATQFGGDEELMRYWVHNGNSHLKYTPYLRIHTPEYLHEMNAYLESFRYR
jgi:hypothetical protein